MANHNFHFNHISPWHKGDTHLNLIIETPKGSRNKFAFDPETGLIRLKSTLAAGMSFPFDFGFIPCTRGEDGDPLDVLLLMDEPAFPGCLVRARLLGVIEAEQHKNDEKPERNDRLIAVWTKSATFDHLDAIDDLNEMLLGQIQDFFISYNRAKDKTFKVLGTKGANAARKIIEAGIKKFEQHAKD